MGLKLESDEIARWSSLMVRRYSIDLNLSSFKLANWIS